MTATKSQIAFAVTLPPGSDKNLYAGREAWEQIEGVTHYDAGSVACNESDADAVEERLAEAGFAPTGFNANFNLMAAYKQAQADEAVIESALASEPDNTGLQHDYAIASASVDNLYAQLRTAGVFK